MQQFRAAIGIVSMFAMACAAAQTVTPHPIGVVDLSAATKSISLATLGNAASRSMGDKIPGTNWLRLQLELRATQPLNGVMVTIYDGLDSKVESIELSGKTNATIWSKLFSSEQYVIRVEGPAQPDGVLTVAAVVRSVDEPEPLSIIGNDGRTKIADTKDPVIRRIARSVIKLFFQDGNITRTCSGFLIAKQRIVTNHHCFHSQEVCDTTTAAIDFLEDGIPSGSKQSRCVKFLGANANLDITVLQLDSTVPSDIQPLKLAQKSSIREQSLHLPQFPSNQPKLISTHECSAVDNPVDGYIKDSDFTHRCDTVDGASGSPVLNLDFEVVGLHHLAISNVPHNRAVRIEPIQAWLKSKGLAP